MKALAYSAELEGRWNEAVAASRNGTFLFDRRYMDYHSDRFTDASLLFVDDKDRVTGLLPASLHTAARQVRSHGGLTYGGLVLSSGVKLTEVRTMLRLAARHYSELGAECLLVKPVPYIYSSYPAEEQLYWLFRAGARLEARGASLAIDLTSELSYSLWRRKVKKAATAPLVLHEGIDTLPALWPIVDQVLAERHHTRPVHSLQEMQLLAGRFPQNIHVYTVANEAGTVITGCVVFVSGAVAHMQYMEANEEARNRTALDWLIAQLISRYATAGLHYLDFGISTEDDGHYLNEGLAFQKEGFGGRTVCYDAWSVALSRLAAI